MRLRGCTAFRLCQRGLLSSVNISQSQLEADPAWIYRAPLQTLKLRLWLKHRLTSQSYLRELLRRDWKERLLYFWSDQVIHNWVLYGRGTLPGSKPDNTQISSELISVLFMADFYSDFDSAKQLCSRCDETTVCNNELACVFHAFVCTPLKT